jgi:hypothetical protein
MDTTPPLDEELFELCEQQLQGRLTPESAARLEKLVRENPQARRTYVEYLHQNASLAWQIGGQGEFSLAALDEMTGNKIVALDPAAVSAPPPVRWFHQTWWRLAAAFALGMFLVLTLVQRPAPPALASAEFATLLGSKNSKWGSGRLPTETGSRFGSGRLRLAEGLATIGFDNGTRISLEAPAELELISPMHCRLHQGVLVARVSPQAKGFTVDTATARLVDYGTEFGVSAGSSGETQVHVVEGIVDIAPRKSGQTTRLTAGKNYHVSATQAGAIDARTFEPQRVEARPAPAEIAPGTITLTTAFGLGKDAFVQSEPSTNHRSDVLLLVKNPISASHRRKAYMGFDLAAVHGKRITDAKLVLTAEPSGYGYASFTPVCKFIVYGLTDQSLDGWKEEAINWDNAPANHTDDGAAVDLTKAVEIGTFEVPEGALNGEFNVSGRALVDFLNQDVNGTATLILTRETQEQKSYSLVHGFASKRHPTGSPPTLRLAVE